MSLKGFAEIKLSSLLTLHFLLEFPCHMYKRSLSSFASLFLLAFFRKQTSLWECHSPCRVFDWCLFLFSFSPSNSCALFFLFYISISRLWVIHFIFFFFRTKALRIKHFCCITLSNTVIRGGSGLVLPLLKDFGTQFRCSVYPKSPLHVTFTCMLFPVLELLRF